MGVSGFVYVCHRVQSKVTARAVTYVCQEGVSVCRVSVSGAFWNIYVDVMREKPRRSVRCVGLARPCVGTTTIRRRVGGKGGEKEKWRSVCQTRDGSIYIGQDTRSTHWVSL